MDNYVFISRGHELDVYSKFYGTSCTPLRKIIDDFRNGEGDNDMSKTEKKRIANLR